MVNTCYCKKCKMNKKVVCWQIDEKDRLKVTMDCFHKPRVFQLITSQEDYKDESKSKSNIVW